MVGNLSANTYRETQPVGADSTYRGNRLEPRVTQFTRLPVNDVDPG